MVQRSKAQRIPSDFFGMVLIIGFFIMSANRLVGIPLDKVFMFLFLVILILKNIFLKTQISNSTILAVVSICAFIFLSFLLNIPDSSAIVFFPVLGVFFAFLCSEEPGLLDVLYYALFAHLMIGLIFVISSYGLGINSYVHPMYDKGVPFLHAAKGFTTTVQTYGTLGITWFLIYYWRKDKNKNKKIDHVFYAMALLALLITFNRNTLLIFYLIIFFKHKKVFFSILFMIAAFYLYFFDFINSVLFNVSTLTSRSDLLAAFRLSFFEDTGWVGYIIGHGNNMVAEEIARTTYYKTGYIENGTAVLLYTYGFLGYLVYLISIILLSLGFWLKKQFFYAFIVFYIFIIAQQFTHEFFSTTFYLMLAAVLIILRNKKSTVEKDSFLSFTE
ncbi:hypothetical protein P872_01500 [Rhodonellum psychrophilum GCM71 = DSM 17998]|uniref:Uncharacterized protein n=2 Tax=Rhodonellum TaxID=336827 RepID=U5C1N0_9BACT|nr:MULTISPECIES: hypothetical protein [Rhodonellum]ERM83963.1 hypothetical protein P872_01500 [Rhodonellum psychrophilum GCM71 = DSM 17998]SDZ05623.1 hypothetical protein SAMN05444412_10575 [Rhodonellum ikkaensis]